MTVNGQVVSPPSIYDAARVALILAGAAGFGWGLVTQQPGTTFAVILSGVGALMAYITSEQTRTVATAVSSQSAVIADKVDVIKANTDGMSKALVASTAKASYIEGQVNGPGVPAAPPIVQVPVDLRIAVLRDALAKLEAGG